MKVIQTRLPGCVAIEPDVFGDARGFFYESYNADKFKAAGLDLRFVQANVSRSARGVLRGLHYQWPNPQGKLVSVLEGEVYDVAVDIRRGSPTFGRWVGVELSAENHRQLWIPEGFAHGFLALEDDTHFLYKTTDRYARECERALRWDDPDIAIDWPLQRLAAAPLVAAKDAAAPRLNDAGVDLFTA